VASVAYREDGTARVLISDFGMGNWRTLADLQIDPEHPARSSEVVCWSPDSSRFAVPEVDRTAHHLRVFDVQEGRSRRVARAFVAGPILWDDDSATLLFSGGSSRDDAGPMGILRVHVDSQRVTTVLLADDLLLLAKNAARNRLLFTGPVHTEDGLLHMFFSCSTTGYGLATLPVDSGAAGHPPVSVSPDGATLALIGESAQVRFLRLP
jgi:hypothetical protein